MTRWWRGWATALVVLLAAAALSVATLRGSGPPTLDDRVHQVASTLRCPVCLNLSVADSPSPVAQEMRRQIREDLQAGMTPDQVRTKFVASYGEWILLTPPRQGLTLVVWVLPPLVFLVAGFVLLLSVRRWGAQRVAPAATTLTEEDRELVARELGRMDQS
jgi:cytochrome c-type biogenesis protein CcmH